MNLVFQKRLFNSEEQEKLEGFKECTSYVGVMNTYEKKKFATFQILWVIKENNPIGYLLINKVTSSFFESDEDGEEIMEVMIPEKGYYYIPYFEIFDMYQKKGIGTLVWKYIREEIGHNDCIVYCTEDSEGFWFKVGFEPTNYSDWWLQYQAS